LFLIVFYGGSLFHVVLAFVASLTSARLMRAVVSNWSSYQSLCARYILGITVKIDGALHNRPVLYAIKHESMFETIQMPSLFYHPSVVAKIQLARIPFWGFAARRYGMIFVDRWPNRAR
jgi:1-acyl-sn-glycerol-3-phosphate acyltransferase